MTSKEKIEKAWELVNSKHIETNEEIQLVRYAVRIARDLVGRDTPHERLLKLGWKIIDTDGTYKTYDKFDDTYTRRTMSIKINKDKDGWYFTATYATYIDKELTTILLEYLEKLDNNK